MIRLALVLVLPLALLACDRQAGETTAAVAMPDPFSAEVAMDVLVEGGSAVDAAVAAAFVLAVTYPEAGNLGGGGFMTLYVDGMPAFLDYRETAPLAAGRDMYLDAAGQVVPGLSRIGAKAAGVPGTVAGLWAAHQRYGRLDWAALVAPAIALAEEGFPVPPELAANAKAFARRVGDQTNFAAYFGDLTPGTRFRQPELAASLRRIAEDGPDGFYKGETARAIRAQMRASRGLITEADLMMYQPVWREPLVRPWRDMTVITAPPPSSGGIALIQLLTGHDALLERFGPVDHNSPAHIHRMAEIEKRVFADRARHLGDPDFWDVPVAPLTDPAYMPARLDAFSPDAVSATPDVRAGRFEAEQTTHFSVLDADGNAVSNTYTLNGSFGAGLVVEGAGFLLNNEMDDFSAKPGVPNLYGVVGGEANAIAPGKRMLSSMTPTIVLKGGRAHLVIGTPGGSTIFTSVYQVLINLKDYAMAPRVAVRAPRVHHQLYPEQTLFYESRKPLPAATLTALTAHGYRLKPRDYPLGDIQLIRATGDGLAAVSDDRGRGRGVAVVDKEG